MAEVNIIIKATDKASAVLGKIGAGANKAFSGATSSLSKFGNVLNSTVQGLTGMNLAQIGVTGAIVAGANAARKAIDNYSNYVEKIDKMTMSTGMQADELSRLVQVADDFRVEMSQVEGALKMALQNGFNPTTENLALLADEIKGIADPTERATRLQEIFGKQWQNIIPLLDQGGEAIRNAAGEISDSLIVTDEAIAQNREYVKAVDDLSDAWAGVQNELAQGVIPTLTKFIQDLTDAQAKIVDNTLLIDGLGGGYLNLTDAQRQALQQMQEQANATKASEAATVDSTSAVERYQQQAAATTQVVSDLTVTQEELLQQFKSTAAVEEFKSVVEDLTTQTFPLFDESVMDATELMDFLLDRMKEFSREWKASVSVDTTAAMGVMIPGGGQSNQNGYKPGSSGPGVTGYTDYIKAGGANGLDMIVPPGYSEPRNPYIVAASSGERVNITRPGESGGDTYQLNVYTTQSPQVVQRGFAIMRAWAGV